MYPHIKMTARGPMIAKYGESAGCVHVKHTDPTPACYETTLYEVSFPPQIYDFADNSDTS